MIPILQISIPTYNRKKGVDTLVKKLIDYNINASHQNILIAIYDNSDKENLELIDLSSSGLISYEWNKKNIGYAGNIKKCLKKSGGYFTWIVSDDDDLNINYLDELVNFLYTNRNEIAGVALPCIVEKLNNKNTRLDISLDSSNGSVVEFKKAVSTKRMPFDFLSSLIIKSSIILNSDIDKITSDNDYYHSLVFCSCLKGNDLIAIYDKPLIYYKGPNSLQWSLMRLVKSKIEICQVLDNLHNIKIQKSEILYEVMKWAVFARAGMFEISTLEQYRFKLIKMALRYFSIKNILLSLLLISNVKVNKIIVNNLLRVKSFLRQI